MRDQISCLLRRDSPRVVASWVVRERGGEAAPGYCSNLLPMPSGIVVFGAKVSAGTYGLDGDLLALILDPTDPVGRLAE